ncbi:hypothetical protein [Microbacterium sp.]|jgi:hypothetical protein|uniref:hypothetical protein n=1 Tax=Microbacterium sp. TaxID=51671 RepID=UPI002615BFBE|nr:hypothetical protein [Microbacterium sp.]
MTTISTVAAAHCDQVQPSAIERAALVVLRALERDIEVRVRRRASTRPIRHAALSAYAEGRADACAGAHVGILPR